MNNDYFDYHIHIEKFSALLLWLTVLCFLGILIIGYAMTVMSRFFLTEKDKETGKVKKFSIIDFELPYSFTRFKNIIDNLSDNTKDTVRMNLKLDYKFMPFAYLFLFFGGWYIMQRHQLFAVNAEYHKVLFFPFIAWVMDILENMLALECLVKMTKTNSRLLFFASLLKWLIIFTFLVWLFVIDWNR
jgi:hypothetical protein